ncbi:MAG TPA: FAD-binding oxidoreductase [Chitinophagaceae bacterium]|nr:FAD-binding oxidoreductase [Chitinophagaceae bacterium]
MSRTYSKREFLRLMGLGIAFMPFISCFDDRPSTDKPKTPAKAPKQKVGAAAPEQIAVTEEDVLLLSRNDAAYAAFNTAFNKRIQHLPKYIAVCKTEKGVQFAIQKAAAEHLKVAVKSGGHSFEGFSSNDGGMVVNVSLMKQIRLVGDNEVEIQPGCLLQDIQAYLFPKKKLLPSGSCGTVGIAGLTLGGGYGFFSRKFGLTCDSLQQLRLVDAAGTIRDSKDDEALLWACKGGGNGNFGVATSFRFRVYDMPPTFDAYVLRFRNMTTERFGNTLSAWFDVSQTLPAEAFGAYVLNGKTLTVLITSYKAYPAFAETIAPIADLSDSKSITLAANLPQAMKRYYGRKGPIFFKNASCGLYQGKEDILKIKDDLFAQVTGNPGIVFQVNTLGGKINDADFAAGSCYPHRHLPFLGELQAYWQQENQETKLTTAFETIQTLFRDSGIKAHYRNYPDINFKDWEMMYYGDNYTRLQDIKRQYDPEDLFHYPQSIRV